MKKAFLPFLFFFALVIIASSAIIEVPEAGIIFISGKPPAAAGESEETCSGSCQLSVSWTGSDVLNTGGGAGHILDTNNDPDSRLSRQTDGNGWNSENNYLRFTGSSSSASYNVEDSYTAQDDFSIRMAIKAGGFADSADRIDFLRVVTSSSNTVGRCSLLNDATPNLYVRCYVVDTGSTERELGTGVQVNTGTWYQIVFMRDRNTAGDDAGAGAHFEVHTENGGSEVGQGVLSSSYTVQNLDHDEIRMGSNYASWDSETVDIDIFYWDNTNVLLSPRIP